MTSHPVADALPGALRRVLVVDRGGWRPRPALRAATGLAVPLVGGYLAGNLTDGVIAAAGALPAGVAGFTGVRPRWQLVLATTAGMTVSTFVGGLTAAHPAGRLAAMAVFGFLAGLLVTLGRSASLIGTQALIGFAVFGRFPSNPLTALGHAGLVALGGATQALVTGIRTPVRFGPERRAVAHLLDRLATQAAGVTRGVSGAPAAEAITDAAALLDRHLDPTEVESLRALVDAASRARLELTALTTVADVPGVAELAEAVAAQLAVIARAVEALAEPADDDGAAERAAERLRAGADEVDGLQRVRRRYASARAQALLGQLRALQRLGAALSGSRRLVLPTVVTSPAPVVMQLGNRTAGIGRRLWLAVTDTSTGAWRHAARLATTLVAADLISRAVPWQRGYWVILTAAVVLKPEYATTVERGIARVIGTGCGAVLIGLLIDGIHPPEPALVAMIVVLGWTSYAVFGASYAVYSFLVSGLVVLLLSPTGRGSLSTAADRGLSTLVGGALAMLAVVVLPAWEGSTLNTALSRLLQALEHYADLVLSGYVDPDGLDRSALSAAADACRRARATAQASRDRAVVEPARLRGDLSTATGVLAATPRIVIALHALRATLEDTESPVALPEGAPMRDGVVAALSALAQQAASGGPADPPTEDGSLREEQQTLLRLAEQPSDGPDRQLRGRRLGTLAVHLDPLVDSIDTVGHLLAASDEPVADDDVAPAGQAGAAR